MLRSACLSALTAQSRWRLPDLAHARKRSGLNVSACRAPLMHEILNLWEGFQAVVGFIDNYRNQIIAAMKF